MQEYLWQPLVAWLVLFANGGCLMLCYFPRYIKEKKEVAMQSKNTQINIKTICSISIVLFTVALYITFGFFFDVFLQVIPVLFLPIVIIPFIFKTKHQWNKKVAICAVICLLVLAIAMSSAVGVIATSKPAQWENPCCGSVQTLKYSRSFMRKTYNIDQGTEVKIWLPDDYSNEKEYPVIYVLDGDVLFNYSAVKAAQHCKNGQGDIIVVGIGYGYWNSTFARGGIVWQDTKHLRGRWRDFCFADDTQAGYMPNTIFGGESKRGKEYTDFIVHTVVADIRQMYSCDNENSTIFGHSLGGGLAAYFLTQYNAKLGNDNPFTNFVIVDNGYLDYYNVHYADLKNNMSRNDNKAHATINIYRIWGGNVNPEGNAEQYELYYRLKDEMWENMNSYLWIPDDANHGDTQTIGIDNALYLILGLEFGHI